MTRTCQVCGTDLGPPMTPEADAVARRELAENFGPIPVEDCGIVCDDCYHRVRAWLEAQGVH